MLKQIPVNIANKKEPLTVSQTFLNPSFFHVENKLRLKLLIEFNNSSYIPEINAIVPPETPGTTSAAPIAIPFMEIIIYSFNDLFIFNLFTTTNILEKVKTHSEIKKTERNFSVFLKI